MRRHHRASTNVRCLGHLAVCTASSSALLPHLGQSLRYLCCQLLTSLSTRLRRESYSSGLRRLFRSSAPNPPTKSATRPCHALEGSLDSTGSTNSKNHLSTSA